MSSIQFIDSRAAARAHPAQRALARAAVAASRAPSVLNTQPWRWDLVDDVAELRAVRDRPLRSVDPDRRLLTISCGAALHHACVALAGAGVAIEVTRLPSPSDLDLLARIRVVAFHTPASAVVRLQMAIALRNADRRLFADSDALPSVLDRLRAAASAQGAHLQLLREVDVAPLTHADPAMKGLSDRRARYAVLVTDADDPAAWLCAGEALSAVLLTAAVERLPVSLIGDIVEIPNARRMLRSAVGGTAHTMLALHVGASG